MSSTTSSDRTGGILSFWEKQKVKALKHQLQRAIHLARCNPDYQIDHPNECRNNPDHKILKECHPEAKKRIEKLVMKKQHFSEVPNVERPHRYNRK